MIQKFSLKNFENWIFPGPFSKGTFFSYHLKLKNFPIFLFLFLYIKTIHACKFLWKNSKNWIFHGQIKIWPILQFQHFRRKNVQEVEKNNRIKESECFFLLLVRFFSKNTEIEFILYLTTNFDLAMKNPILGFFSQKFTCMYSFYV